MLYGLTGGLLWALDTVLLGLMLAMSPFCDGAHALMIAPLVSTFLHDAASALYLGTGMILKREGKELLHLLRHNALWLIIVASLLGGPIGMTGYVESIKYLGAGPTAVFSSLFPALGCVLSLMILKERMSISQIMGLVVSLISVALLSLTDMASGENMLLGFLFAFLCVFGWASEAVLVKHAMVKTEADEIHALFVRQSVSALTYLFLILPLMKGFPLTGKALESPSMFLLLVTSLFGTLSYICYYKAISKVGAGKAMSLNITYTAWAVAIGSVISGKAPAMSEIVLGAMTVTGALIAAGAFSPQPGPGQNE